MQIQYNIMKLRVLSQAIFILTLGSVIAQNQLDLPNFTPPSPSAYELGKYGEYPIGMFTGTSQFSVPLLEFKGRSISVPISLYYSSNGIKVNQLETKVGLGWNLMAGGAITRIVNQNPDELRAYSPPSSNSSGYKTPQWINYFFDMSHNVSGTMAQPTSIDGEPDIFTVNVLGRTARFTFQNNNQLQIIMLDNTSLRVVYNPVTNGGDFLVVDENGVKYYFDAADSESTKMETLGGSTPYNHFGHFMTTSWNLSRIETPNNEIITFTYASETYNYVTSQSQHATIASNAAAVNSGTPCFEPFAPTESPILNHHLYVNGKRLSGISSNTPEQGSIVFQYSIVHPTITNYSLLSSIVQKDKLLASIEEVSLDYSTINQRMFLNGVQFLDPDKTYGFEYNALAQVPQRLSYAQDHWGYYNGKSNSKLYPDLASLNNVYGNRFSAAYGNGANREVDEAKAKIGLLQKVIYPTKGYTIIDYESHTYVAPVTQQSEKTVKLEISTAENYMVSQSTTVTDIAQGGLYKVNLNFSLNYRSMCVIEGPVPIEEDRKLYVSIENLTNPSQTNIIHLMGSWGVPIGISNSAIIRPDDMFNDKYYFNLNAGHEYQITLYLNHECLMGGLSLTYPDSASQTIYVNKKTGGLRVSKTTNYDTNNTVLSTKKYHYARRNNLTSSSGDPGLSPYYFSTIYSTGSCPSTDPPPAFSCLPWKIEYIRLNSGALNAMYRSSVQNTRYEYITVSESSTGFENGGVEYIFNMASIPQSYEILGMYSHVYSEGQSSWGDGLELQKTSFKMVGGNQVLVSRETNGYSRDTRINNVVNGYKVSRKYILPCRSFLTSDPNEINLITAEDELDVTHYYFTSNWFYLKSKTIETFDLDGANPVTATTQYVYNSPVHQQVSETREVNSNGKVMVTKNYYPDDIIGTTSLLGDELSGDEMAALNKLKTTATGPDILYRPATLIQTESYIDLDDDGIAETNELLSIQRNNYKEFASNNMVLPKDVQTLKGVYNAANNVLQERIIYHGYDGNGNPLEVSKAGGASIYYIWGYNGQFPIAKIENFTSSQANAVQTSLINPAIVASNNDSSLTNENTLRTKLNDLRNGLALSAALVTTYTYDPLIGVTSMTDPRGYTVYYEYDDLHRLEKVRDAAGKLLSTNTYHYKN